MQRDPFLDHDYTQDDQPTAAPGLLQFASVEGSSQKARRKLGLQVKSAQEPEANETEKVEAEEPVVKEGPSSESPDNSSNTSSSNITNVTTAPPESDAQETSGEANVTKCATKKDPRATSWWIETAPEGTPCVFGVDARDEGAHCILESEEFGSNGWCFTKEDKSQWGSCNGDCPLQGPNAALGEKLDSVAESVQGVSDKVGGKPVASDTDESPAPETPATNESVAEPSASTAAPAAEKAESA
jgi:hypothetical protein